MQVNIISQNKYFMIVIIISVIYYALSALTTSAYKMARITLQVLIAIKPLK